MTTQETIAFIDSQITSFQEGDISCIQAYKTLRGLKNHIENAIKSLEEDVREEVQSNPGEYFDFNVSTRTTYNYKDSPLFVEKQSELKEIEKTLKMATEMANKGSVYCDENGEAVFPVTVKYTSVLTYKPRG